MDSSLLLAWTLQSVQTETTGTCRALDSEVQCSVDRDRQGRAGAAGVAQLEVNIASADQLSKHNSGLHGHTFCAFLVMFKVTLYVLL